MQLRTRPLALLLQYRRQPLLPPTLQRQQYPPQRLLERRHLDRLQLPHLVLRLLQFSQCQTLQRQWHRQHWGQQGTLRQEQWILRWALHRAPLLHLLMLHLRFPALLEMLRPRRRTPRHRQPTRQRLLLVQP